LKSAMAPCRKAPFTSDARSAEEAGMHSFHRRNRRPFANGQALMQRFFGPRREASAIPSTLLIPKAGCQPALLGFVERPISRAKMKLCRRATSIEFAAPCPDGAWRGCVLDTNAIPHSRSFIRFRAKNKFGQLLERALGPIRRVRVGERPLGPTTFSSPQRRAVATRYL
jgi:hypothetical protein